MDEEQVQDKESASPHRTNGEHLADLGPEPAGYINSSELAGLHVMVVDDEPDAREVVAAMLTRAGARVSSAGSVREAIDLFEQIRPDVLVSDIAMPDCDGYDLIRLVRDLSPHQGGRTPAIALTAYAREEDRFRALTAGYQAHLAKPVTPANLTAAISQVAANDFAQDRVR